MGRAYCTGRLSRAAPGLEWCTILISLITLLKVWAWRPWRFSRGLLFQAPCKINQSFIKVRSPHELLYQIEQCSRLVSRYCSIKLISCWGRWLKYSLPHKTRVLCADNWKSPSIWRCKTLFLKGSFFEVFFSLRYLLCAENVLCQEKRTDCILTLRAKICKVSCSRRNALLICRHFPLCTI